MLPTITAPSPFVQRNNAEDGNIIDCTLSIPMLRPTVPYFNAFILCSSENHKHAFELLIQLHHRQRFYSRSSYPVQHQVLLGLRLVSIPSPRHVLFLLSLREVSPMQTYELSTYSKAKTARWNQDTQQEDRAPIDDSPSLAVT